MKLSIIDTGGKNSSVSDGYSPVMDIELDEDTNKVVESDTSLQSQEPFLMMSEEFTFAQQNALKMR